MKDSKLFLLLTVLLVSAQLNYAQIVSAQTGNWSDVATWTGGAVPGAVDDVVIASGHTVTLDAAGLSCRDLSISGTLQFSAYITVNLTVNEDINILTGGTLRVLTNTLGISSPNGGLFHTLDLKGNLIHTGTQFDFRTGSAGSTLGVCNITLSGTATSTLNVPYVSSSNGEFNYITINKTAPGKVILESNIVTAGGSGTGPSTGNSGINFLSGIVETGSFMLAYQGSTSGQIIGGSLTSYVIGTLARGMSSSAGSNKDFLVGDANGYRPFYLRSTTSGAATGHLALVKCVTGDANIGSSNLIGDINKVSEVRYYQVSYSNTLGGAASMSFDLFKVSYDADDGVASGNSDLRVAFSTDNRANWTEITQTTEHITSLPSQITPDAISAHNLASGSSMYVVLARANGTTTNPLPVELTSFVANLIGSNVILGWQTATELNNYGFEIERSNNKINFEKIGFVQGCGNSNSDKNYSFTDKQKLSGKYYYRLKQIDNDGAFEYSKVVEAVFELPKTFNLSQNYPNPFNPSTIISYSVPKAEYVRVAIYNSIGQEIKILVSEVKEAGIYKITFNASEYSSGLYFYELRAGSFSSIKKMIFTK